MVYKGVDHSRFLDGSPDFILRKESIQKIWEEGKFNQEVNKGIIVKNSGL